MIKYEPKIAEIKDKSLEKVVIDLGRLVITQASRVLKRGDLRSCRVEDISELEGAAVEVSFGNLDNPNMEARGKNIIGIIPTSRCSHDTCVMCNYGGVPNLTSVSSDLITKLQINYFEKILVPKLEMYNAHSAKAMFTISMVNLLGAGSWYDCNEIPDKARNYFEKRSHEILMKFLQGRSKDKGLAIFATETRPEYITEDNVAATRENLGDRTFIEVGWGLESLSSLVREGLVNKKLPDNYNYKIELMHRVGFETPVQLFVGAPALSEVEIINDTAYSIVNGAKYGPVYLMPAYLKKNTVTGYLASVGEYTPPSRVATFKAVEVAGEFDVNSLRGAKIFGMDSGVKFERPLGWEETKESILLFNRENNPHEKLKIAKKAVSKYFKTNNPPNTVPLSLRVIKIYETIARGIMGKSIRCYAEYLGEGAKAILIDYLN